MIKIAIPSKENRVDHHFGHCEYLTIIELNDQLEILKLSPKVTARSCGCKSNLAEELASEGVKFLLAGGIGQGAINKLKTQNIEVIAGFQGTIEEVIEKWKAKDYPADISICTEHHSCSH
ncbi:NifB/NifX family molybdenum-iron cluster-binding protein [Sunxiuqinia sp. sy24]|uniref:NifB/NifX family molybdenum-iron cluster-binding protein n=1 Tax=Sunxiuqinia sp. sy24 TaxID=3461495 RepID=UPI0040460D68